MSRYRFTSESVTEGHPDKLCDADFNNDGFLNGHWPRAALLAVDAMLLEVAANVFSLLGFGTWLFRYHAPDLHHFTTIEAFPIYLFGGYLGVRVLHAGESHPKRALLGAVLYTVTLVAVFGLNCG